MKSSRGVFHAVLTLLLITSAVFIFAAPAQAEEPVNGICPTTEVPPTENGVCPEEVGNRIKCQDLAYINGFKIDAGTFSEYPFELLEGTQNGVSTELFGPGPFNADARITASSDGKTVSWSSNFSPINAVLVKGGPETNQYLYWGPDLYSDEGLVAPDNFRSRPVGDQFGVSNVQFCFPIDYTYVELAEFYAVETADGATITWKTAVEIDNAGFNLYRADSVGAEFVQINTDIIAAKGSGVSGASYTYSDDVGPGTYQYMLEDIDFSNVKTTHDPVTVIVGGQKLYIPSLASTTTVSPAQE